MHGYPGDTAHSLPAIAKISGIPIGRLRKVYSRGVGAYWTNPTSVRPHVTSPEQWAQARVYAFVHKVNAGLKLNHDTDLV